MSNKNPFEVRLEVLKMAKDMMDAQYGEANSIAWTMVENWATAQNKAFADVQEYYQQIKPAMYTPEDVMKKATELYSFVTKKD